MKIELHYNSGAKISRDVEKFYDAEDIIKFGQTFFIYEDVMFALDDNEILIFKEATIKELK